MVNGKLKTRWTKQMQQDLINMYYGITPEDHIIKYYLKLLWKINLDIKYVHDIRTQYYVDKQTKDALEYFSKKIMSGLNIPI